ncbi:MAG: group II intron reverse transcriptase/maturase [Pseudanabaena sp.]
MQNGLMRVAEKAKREPNGNFNNLAHHITANLLGESLKQIPSGSGKGVDGQSKQEAVANFAEWSAESLTAIHRRSYRPPPVRRVYIPKPGKDELRPIGVPTIIDRCIQRSTAKVLESIWEQDFLPCSYGGRPNRSALQAISTMQRVIAEGKISWVYEADLKNFFGSLDHSWLMKFVRHRISDERILLLITRWLKDGVMEDGVLAVSTIGTPQGGSISVLLSNIYLHYTLDLWFEKIVKPCLEGEAYLIRYLDDFIVCFQFHRDAVRFQKALQGRLDKFKLSLEPSKTKLMEFGKFAKPDCVRKGVKPPSFVFLGFRVYGLHFPWGYYAVASVVDGKRRCRFIDKLKESMRSMRHCSLKVQADNINRKLQGYYNYFGIPFNSKRLRSLYNVIMEYWRLVLSSRSQSGFVDWKKYRKILANYPIKRPRILFNREEFRAMGLKTSQ